MKQTLYCFFIFCLIVTALGGCQNRQVTSIVDPTELIVNQNSDTPLTLNNATSPPAISTNSSQGQVTSEAITTSSPSSSNTQSSVETPPTQDSGVSPQTPAPTTNSDDSTPSTVIVAESENLDDVDERAILLNELDSMLSTVLTSLENMEENPITEDITNIGGK